MPPRAKRNNKRKNYRKNQRKGTRLTSVVTNKSSRVLRQPFPNVTKRILPYAFRDQLQPPATSTGGFSVASIAYRLNSPYDVDPTTGTISTSARINHQPMGYDQIMALYSKQRVDWAKIRINFAINRSRVQIDETVTPAGSGTETITGNHYYDGPIRVGLLITDDPTLDPSLLVQVAGTVAFEKLIEQSKSGQLPNGTSLRYKTIMPNQRASLSAGVNPFKFFNRHDKIGYSDWLENNQVGSNSAPGNIVYCHIIASPISVNPGDQHPKVTFYGDMSFGMTFSDLKQLGQS
ncbi:MAG: putative capsid protein [Cressdnaviricota sp.]|nr:MAG: putative capsid protein [Cressdnaviricota sp.]